MATVQAIAERAAGTPAENVDAGFRRALLRAGLIGAAPGTPPPADWQAAVLDVASRHFGAARVDLAALSPNPALIDRLGADLCLRLGLVPLRQAGAVTFVATARPEAFAAHRARLEERLGPVAMVLAPAEQIEAAVIGLRGGRLARVAESCVRPSESCRGWGGPALRLWGIVTLAGTLALLAGDPRGLVQILLAVAILALIAGTGLKLAAAVAALRPAPSAPPPPDIARLPVVSVIVALYRESDIAARLVRRLSRLDYPRDLLEVCLAVEAEDSMTRDALARADLPDWMRVVVVPAGKVKTKPRALNHALGQCRGSIIGVYDAEDAPDPDQIRRVVRRFYSRGPDLACVQGMLDYYNPFTNWLSRCFTLEYGNWFRLILPGIARLGLVIPLGGTTLFFRREVLEELGGWDAHNVTEDADLGIRLFRHGYRTEILDTVTMEEANCRPMHWIRQRSRWIKGYMMTWIVHMRDPVLLWRQLGPRRFLGLQVQILVSTLQTLLAPLLWAFWVVPLGTTGLDPVVQRMVMVLCLSALVSDLVLGYVALRRSGHRLSPLWLLTLHAYYPLATLAAYKALWELVTRPFYWDKTSHGHFDTARPTAGPVFSRGPAT